MHSTPIAAAADALVERIEWSPLTAFSVFNEIWGFSISTRVDATFRAVLVRVGRHTTSTGRQVALTMVGTLTHARPRVVRFAFAQLKPARYHIEVVVTRRRQPLLSLTRASPAFLVE